MGVLVEKHPVVVFMLAPVRTADSRFRPTAFPPGLLKGEVGHGEGGVKVSTGTTVSVSRLGLKHKTPAEHVRFIQHGAVDQVTAARDSEDTAWHCRHDHQKDRRNGVEHSNTQLCGD